jgi:hypothetical protein
MVQDEAELCFGELSYQTRIVAFFDILGWKNEIAAAADDPRRVARLAAAVRTFNAHGVAVGHAGARLTTFSDNVVFSKPFAQGDVQWLLQSLATTQLGLAVQGFWIRGAVTIGSLHHDEHIVFGPALNRAYHLESKVACYPRILIDAPSFDLLPETDFVVAGEETFLDPFTPSFWDRIQAELPIQKETLDRFNELSGMSIPIEPAPISGVAALASVATRLSRELEATGDPVVWKKLAWLFDRVVRSLGGQATAAMLPKSARLREALDEAIAEI